MAVCPRYPLREVMPIALFLCLHVFFYSFLRCFIEKNRMFANKQS